MRILIAEDDPIARRILEATLRKDGYDVVVACDGTAAWDQLRAPDAPQLAVLDWMMPGLDGPEVCRRLRRRTDSAYTYVLLLTAKGTKQDIIEGLEAGADDYLVKPFDSFELKARLNVGKRILGLQRQFEQVCDELRLQAARDSLTGLWNHAAILDRLDQEVARARRQESALGVIMADLDHFKSINDTHGHPAGDEVLRRVSQHLRSLLRTYDAVGRYGGEEFMIVLPGCDADKTARLAERLRQEIALAPINLGTRSVSVTISLGATAFDQGTCHDAAALLHVADASLYQAKRSGRNRVEFAALESDGASRASFPLTGVPA